MVPVLVTEIYNEFINEANAASPVNIDCKVMEVTEENLKNNPNRWSFDEAADHIYCLMKNDSYQRFLRSEMYRDLVREIPMDPDNFWTNSSGSIKTCWEFGPFENSWRDMRV